MSGKMGTAGSPPSPDAEASGITSEVSVDASAQGAIPLQDLQAQSTDADNKIQDANISASTPAQPELPPIDKRGFLTLLAQHVSRYVRDRRSLRQQACS